MADYRPRTLAMATFEARMILTDITVVIPTLGRPILEESLYWILAGSAWPGGLIVVDQGQNPQVEVWIRKLQSMGIAAVYSPSEQRGRAAGVNKGIEQVKTRYFAITDDDCFVEEKWLERMVARLDENPGAIVTGRVEAGSDDVIVVVTSQVSTIQHRPRLKFDSMSGGNMGTSLEVIVRVGLFDEDPRLRTAEDGEWAYRALRTGVPIVYAPEVCVRHFGWREEGARTTQYGDYARSHGGFYGKYIRQGDWFIVLRALMHHIRAFRRWIRGLITGDQEMSRLGQAYLTGLLPGMLTGMRSRNSVKSITDSQFTDTCRHPS